MNLQEAEPLNQEVWLEVCEAYKVLTDPKRRSRKNGMTKQGGKNGESRRFFFFVCFFLVRENNMVVM